MVWDAQWNHYLGLGHYSGDPRGDPMGDSKSGIGDSYDGNDSQRWFLWEKLLEMVWDAQCNHYLGQGHDYGDPRGDSNDPAKYSPLRAP